MEDGRWKMEEIAVAAFFLEDAAGLPEEPGLALALWGSPRTYFFFHSR